MQQLRTFRRHVEPHFETAAVAIEPIYERSRIEIADGTETKGMRSS